MDEDIEDEDEDSDEEDEDNLEGGGIRVLFFCVVASSLVCFSALRWFTVQMTRYSITSVSWVLDKTFPDLRLTVLYRMVLFSGIFPEFDPRTT